MLLSNSLTSKTQSLTTTSTSSDSTARVPQKTLGQDDFLKLISVQLTHQDPSKPMEDTAFIAQMAQFTSLDQTKQLVGQVGQLTSSNHFSLARALMGQQVTVTDPATGKEVSGLVSGVDTQGTDAAVIINGSAYSLDSIKKVETPVATAAN